MGMFDYINLEMKCPNCGETVSGFQSKSGPCLLLTLDPWCVDNFYAPCQKCGEWIEYRSLQWQKYVNESFLTDKKSEYIPTIFENYNNAVSLLKEYCNIQNDNDLENFNEKVNEFLAKEINWLDCYIKL